MQTLDVLSYAKTTRYDKEKKVIYPKLTAKSITSAIFMPPFEKGEAYCFAHVGRYVGRSVGRSVGMSVSLNLVQLITQERFAPEASSLVSR